MNLLRWVGLFLLANSFSCHPVLAWGGRGHHTICDAATYLVKDKNLRQFMQQKPQIMGHLCNIPDTHWKNLGSDVSKIGSPAHYVDVEILGIPFKDIPHDYKQIVETYTGKTDPTSGKTIRSIPTEFGSNWWRADQFFRRAVELGKTWKSVAPPANTKEEQSDDLPYNKIAYDFYVNLGLMGHFVGDNSQPFHLTIDYDGYKAGHGGIHAYYEDTVVSALSYKLLSKVVEEGKRLQKLANSKNKKAAFLNEKTVIGKMKALGEISLSEVKSVFALDKVKKPSIQKSEKGMSLKTPAERLPAEEVAQKFEPLVVAQMGRSAALLAQLWDEAYVAVVKPPLGVYKSYKYPFTPDFVAPDYFDLKILDQK